MNFDVEKVMKSGKIKTFLFHKPYGVLSQFTREIENQQVISDFYEFPKDVYPVGRLDKDSEGLLLLTNDSSLVDQILNPKNIKKKTYLVQVEGAISTQAIDNLMKGVEIKLPNKKKYFTKPCQAEKITPPQIDERNPPIRYRANIPTSWVRMTITEGKNRQIRKMCAKVGYPALRLIRISIAQYELANLQPGEVQLI